MADTYTLSYPSRSAPFLEVRDFDQDEPPFFVKFVNSH